MIWARPRMSGSGTAICLSKRPGRMRALQAHDTVKNSDNSQLNGTRTRQETQGN